MPTPEEQAFAARLYHLQILDRDAARDCLKLCEQRGKAGEEKASLEEILVERGLLTEQEVIAFSDRSLADTQPIPKYEIHEQVGEGGMATIWRATYRPLDKEVAIKLMKPEFARKEHLRTRFFRESGILRHVRHENIVPVFEDGDVGPYQFYAMDFVHGDTLLDRVDDEGPLKEVHAIWVVRQMALAMAYMDRRGVIHRDMKPSNVLLSERLHATLLDFGLAQTQRMRDDGEAGMTVGTVEYISPEQARGHAVDVRSDLYSLGVTLFHAVFGDVPFQGRSDQETLRMQVMETLSIPDEPRVQPLTRRLIEQMMAKNPDERFQHPDDVVTMIDRVVPDLAERVERSLPAPKPKGPFVPKLEAGRGRRGGRGRSSSAGRRRRRR